MSVIKISDIKDYVWIISIIIGAVSLYYTTEQRIMSLDDSIKNTNTNIAKITDSLDAIEDSVNNIDKRLQKTENYIDFVVKNEKWLKI